MKVTSQQNSACNSSALRLTILGSLGGTARQPTSVTQGRRHESLVHASLF